MRVQHRIFLETGILVLGKFGWLFDLQEAKHFFVGNVAFAESAGMNTVLLLNCIGVKGITMQI